MKKLIGVVIIVLGCTSFYVATGYSENVASEPSYTEVNLNQVPLTLKATLETAYSGAKLVRAYVNIKKEYKLELSVGNQHAIVYTDENGNW